MEELQTIGDYLRKEAMRIPKDTKLKDAFIRSAYNRYYYSCFLLSKNMIEKIFVAEHIKHKATKEKIKKIYEQAKNKYKKTDDEKIKSFLKKP